MNPCLSAKANSQTMVNEVAKKFLFGIHFPYGLLTDELLLVKCDNNKVAPERRIQKGPAQNVIDKLTAERISCGERAQSVVDVNEIMLRCDVNPHLTVGQLKVANSFNFNCRCKMIYDNC